MKPVASYGIVNADTSGPGAFLRAAKWYWDELTDMFAAAGFTSVMIPLVPNTENVSRNGAPICTASIRTRFGSVKGYLKYLNAKGIENVEAVTISAQAMYNSLFETGLSMDGFCDGFFEYAVDAAKALKELGGSTVVITPTPGVGFLNQEFKGDEEKLKKFQKDMADCINKIGIECKGLGLNTAVKNEFFTTVAGDKIDDFLKVIDEKVVSYTPDPAHLYIADVDYLRYFEKYAGKLQIAYFTDTKYKDVNNVAKTISPEFPQDGDNQRIYWDLGYGNIDFDSLYQMLLEAGFDGPVILDSKYSLDVAKGILRMRTFWNRLTKNNAKESNK